MVISERSAQVLEALANGLTYDDIRVLTSLCRVTVCKDVSGLYAELGIPSLPGSRNRAVAMAATANLLRLGDIKAPGSAYRSTIKTDEYSQIDVQCIDGKHPRTQNPDFTLPGMALPTEDDVIDAVVRTRMTYAAWGMTYKEIDKAYRPPALRGDYRTRTKSCLHRAFSRFGADNAPRAIALGQLLGVIEIDPSILDPRIYVPSQPVVYENDFVLPARWFAQLWPKEAV